MRGWRRWALVSRLSRISPHRDINPFNTRTLPGTCSVWPPAAPPLRDRALGLKAENPEIRTPNGALAVPPGASAALRCLLSEAYRDSGGFLREISGINGG